MRRAFAGAGFKCSVHFLKGYVMTLAQGLFLTGISLALGLFMGHHSAETGKRIARIKRKLKNAPIAAMRKNFNSLSDAQRAICIEHMFSNASAIANSITDFFDDYKDFDVMLGVILADHAMIVMNEKQHKEAVRMFKQFYNDDWLFAVDRKTGERHHEESTEKSETSVISSDS